MSQIQNIIPIGRKVKTKIGGLEAMIVGINVRGEKMDSIEYHISWFSSGESKYEWVWSFEVEEVKENRTEAGFYKPESKKLLK